MRWEIALVNNLSNLLISIIHSFIITPMRFCFVLFQYFYFFAAHRNQTVWILTTKVTKYLKENVHETRREQNNFRFCNCSATIWINAMKIIPQKKRTFELCKKVMRKNKTAKNYSGITEKFLEYWKFICLVQKFFFVENNVSETYKKHIF